MADVQAVSGKDRLTHDFVDLGDGGFAEVVVVQNAQNIVLQAQIALNGSLTGVIDLGRARLARIVMPAAWDAANLTFDVSYDGAAFAPLYDASGTEYTVVAAAARSILVPLADFIGVRWLKIRSGPVAGPVVQTAARTFNLALVQ